MKKETSYIDNVLFKLIKLIIMETIEEWLIKKNMMYHILLKNLGSETYYKTGELHEKIYNAMQEYAKQYEAANLRFAEWCYGKWVKINNKEKCWMKDDYSEPTGGTHTTKELFEIFNNTNK